MLTIYKLRADHVVDFAAEELKKYLRMMMPRCGEIDICYDPAAKEGFRLGLLEDFKLPNEAKDPVLDDIVHIDTTCEGGILAGSNPRSVLFAVYRYLKLNGCRWLYPGTDGEHIPIEQRDPDEIKTMWYEKPMALADVKCYNPSFDVTDHELITAIITEKGICRAPYTESLTALFDNKE